MLKHEVYTDIQICKEIIESKDSEKAKKHGSIIIGSYGDYILGIQNNLDLYSFRASGTVDYLGDIEILKRKLELFLSNGCTPTKNYEGKLEINNNNNNKNINTNNINIELIFSEARETIQKDESLSEEEMDEVLKKIDEIESINNLKEPRNKKWFKLKPIMEWIGTKGIVVAAAILNLITSIIKAN